jgi:DNA-binding XRE family transcriptional regulator
MVLVENNGDGTYSVHLANGVDITFTLIWGEELHWALGNTLPLSFLEKLRAEPLVGMSFGERLRYFRKGAGLTQKALAKKADISNPYLCQIEKHSRSPSAVILYRIAKALNVRMECFFKDYSEVV